jgi:hypothetical protein
MRNRLPLIMERLFQRFYEVLHSRKLLQVREPGIGRVLTGVFANHVLGVSQHGATISPETIKRFLQEGEVLCCHGRSLLFDK